VNRRGFLKALGALGVIAAGAAQPFRAAIAGPVWDGEFEHTPEGLRRAIEALFPAGVQTSVKAYEEYPFGFSAPLTPKDEERHYGPIQRVVHRVYGLAFVVTGNEERDARLRRALYLAMYNTAFLLAQHTENHQAILMWRRTPDEQTYRDSDFEADILGPMLTRITMRLGLRQTGWRERLFVEPRLSGYKQEGTAIKVMAA